MSRRLHYIDVPRDVKDFLQRAFGVEEKTVRNALTYVSDSPLALRIRSLALQKGGVELYVVSADELERLRRG